MFRQNYYPYNMNYNYGYNNFNKFNNNLNYNQYNPNFNNQNNQKKDTDSTKVETIPFKDYTNCESNTNPNNSVSTEKKGLFNIFGLSFEIDDLILIGLIILLFLESDKNYALIIILGLILLNVNLSDILNIF